jgi:uncharacterized protein (TIGR00255 family)
MKSMTGYGKTLLSTDDYEIEIEIRSLNHRYLDMRILLPRELNPFEPSIRDIITQRIRRGKVDVRINFRDKRLPVLQLDEAKLKALWSVYQRARACVDTEQSVSFDLLMREDGIIHQEMPDIEGFNALLDKALNLAIDEHQLMADKEGTAMLDALLVSLDKMHAYLDVIRTEYPKYRDELLERFKTQIPELLGRSLTSDDLSRIFTEVAIYVDRSDIHEEITRLNDHLDKFKHLAVSDQSVGKTFNFILQEMHREINTIGDKFNLGKVFHEIIGIKEEIEKCREMVQNVE